MEVRYTVENFLDVAKNICQQLGGTFHDYYYILPQNFGTGIVEAYDFGNYSMMYSQYKPNEEIRIERSPGQLKHHLILDVVINGESKDFSVYTQSTVKTLVPGCYLSTPSTPSVGIFEPRYEHKLFSILLHLDWLNVYTSLNIEDIINDPGSPDLFYVPLSSSLLSSLQGLAISEPRTMLRKNYLQAKTLEIISSTLEMLIQSGTRSFTFSPQEVFLFNQVMEYVQEHIQEPVTIHQLAKKFGVNKNKLQDLSKTITGKPMGTYIRVAKMTEAYQRIEQGYSVQETGRFVGYSNISHFARAFYGVHRMNPSDLKKPAKPDK